MLNSIIKINQKEVCIKNGCILIKGSKQTIVHLGKNLNDNSYFVRLIKKDVGFKGVEGARIEFESVVYFRCYPEAYKQYINSIKKAKESHFTLDRCIVIDIEDKYVKDEKTLSRLN